MRKMRKVGVLVAIKFKDNVADIVKTVDRVGLIILSVMVPLPLTLHLKLRKNDKQMETA